MGSSAMARMAISVKFQRKLGLNQAISLQPSAFSSKHADSSGQLWIGEHVPGDPLDVHKCLDLFC
jgi:hypothetical protein